MEKESPGSKLAKYLMEPSDERLAELEDSTQKFFNESFSKTGIKVTVGKITNGFNNQARSS